MILRQSTATTQKIGPFLDRTNGYDAETGESPAVKLSKNGGSLAAKNEGTTPSHDADGYYSCALDTTDTNTVGTLVLEVPASGNALPVRHEYQVISQAAYDAIYASGAAPATAALLLAADDMILSVLGSPAGVSVSADVAAVKAQTAEIETVVDRLERGKIYFVVQVGTTDTIILTDLTGYGSLAGRSMIFDEDDPKGQGKRIASSSSGGASITLDSALDEAPAQGTRGVIV